MQVSTTVSFFLAALSALLAGQSAIALELCEIQTLTSGGPPLSDGFGSATAMDDPYLVVGAGGDDTLGSAAGAVYVFLREDLTWTQQIKLTASDGGFEDGFGFSVDIDGDRLVVGAPGISTFFGQFGKAYVFQREGTTWTEQVRLVSSGSSADDNFGKSVSICGDTVVVGAEGEDDFTGRAYVFRWNGTAWIEEASFRASDTEAGDGFGSAVALDGDLLAVGARLNDDACPEDPFCNSGSAYLFRYEKGSWIEKSKITASDAEFFDKFGAYLDLDGNRIAVGVPTNDDAGSTSGSAYVFNCGGASCVEEAKMTASDAAQAAEFGRSIALDNDLLLVGSPFANTQAGLHSGSAYLFQRSGSNWIEIQKLIPRDAGAGSRAGWGVAIDAGYAVAGATAVGHAHVYGFNVPPCIPTVSAWGLLAMVLILLIAGSLVARRVGRGVS